MKALRAELAVELVGGVVSVLALQAYWELWSTGGTAGTPTPRQSIVRCEVAVANPFTGLFRGSFQI